MTEILEVLLRHSQDTVDDLFARNEEKAQHLRRLLHLQRPKKTYKGSDWQGEPFHKVHRLFNFLLEHVFKRINNLLDLCTHLVDMLSGEKGRDHTPERRNKPSTLLVAGP